MAPASASIENCRAAASKQSASVSLTPPAKSYSEALRVTRHPSKYTDKPAKAGSAASKATKVL
jgi:hypothetical protein